MLRVRVTAHARRRWVEYGGTGNLEARRVAGALRHRLRIGVKAERGAVRVPLSGLEVLCVPEVGGWVAVTVVRRSRSRNRFLRERFR
jgi:hypothetical protein